jgi:hypothetical protein
MSLILAIEPDRKQAARITTLARSLPGAELLLANSTDQALASLEGRVPQLILTSLLLSPKDEAGLRALNGAGAPVPTLMIPVFATGAAQPSGRGGFLARLPWSRSSTGGIAPGTTGCDPSVFASQIWEYLQSTATEDERNEEKVLPPDATSPQELEEVGLSAVSEVDTPVPSAVEGPAWGEVEATPDTYESEDKPHLETAQEGLAESPALAGPAAEEAAWDEIAIGDEDTSSPIELSDELSETTIELSGETIDLRAFVQELEAAEREFATPRVATIESLAAESADMVGEPAIDEVVVPQPVRVTVAHALPDHPSWPPLEGVLAEELSHEELLAIVADFDAALEYEPDMPGTMDADSDLWMPLSVGGSASWPRLENAYSRPRVLQDEWGFFDPEQCGFSALIAKLDQISK